MRKLTLVLISCFLAALLVSPPSLAGYRLHNLKKSGASGPPPVAPQATPATPAQQEAGNLSTLVSAGEAEAGVASAEVKSEVNESAVGFKPGMILEQLPAPKRHKKPGPEAFLAEGPEAPAGDISPPTEAPSAAVSTTAGEAVLSQAPDDLRIFKSHNLSSTEAPTNRRSTTHEPTAINLDNAVFYTANTYAAKSSDGGSSFTYINPFNFFPSVNGGFCCDQVTAYAPVQDMALWGLQYREDANTGTFRLARAIGSAGIANNNWRYWDFTPQNVGFANGNSFDYPSMTVAGNFLYITSNVFSTSGQEDFTGSVVIRIPLSDLAAGTSINYNYFFSTSVNTPHCTEGAGATMYFAGFINTTQMRIHRWPESTNTISWDNVQLQAFTRLKRDGAAPSPDGTDWAAWADSRTMAAYVVGGVIGVMFMAKQDANFPYPYTIHVRFNESTRALISQGEIWNSNFAWLYPSASPNASGHLAGTLQIGGTPANGSAPYPGTRIWISDDVQPGGSTIGDVYVLTNSNAGPSMNRWGDYFSVRPHKVYTNTWVIASHTLRGGQTGSDVVPNYTWFGREKHGPGPTCFTSTISFGQTLNRTLATTDCMFAGGKYYDAYTFSGSAGQQVSISLSSFAYDTYLYLSRPGGALLAEDDDGGNGSDSRIPPINGFFTLPSTGTYTIRASSFFTNATGGYALTLNLNTPSTAGLRYYALPTPIRLLDTRAGQPACDNPGAPIAAGSTRVEQARLTCGGVTIPANAQAIAGNATVVNNLPGAGPGFITLYPSGASRPAVSNINYVAGQVLSNAFTVGLSTGGAFNIFALSTTDFIVDVTGYYAPPPGGLYFHPLPRPVRLLDTRIGQTACDAPGAPIAAGTTRTEMARRTCDGIIIPNDAQAVVGNATVVNNAAGSGPGFITLYPSGAARPNVSNINYTAGQVLSNAFAVGLGGNGDFDIFALSTTDLIVDVSGYFSASAEADANGVAGLLYNPLPSPFRLLDTRPGEPACYNPGSPLGGGVPWTQPARGTCGSITVPASALAVVGNATVVNTAAGNGFGYVTLYPNGTTRPNVSNLNYGPGQVLSNSFTVGLGSDGAFKVFPFSTTHFIADINAYYAP